MFSVFYDLDLNVNIYARLEAEISNPFPFGQNVFTFPEESNVLVKKIRSNFWIQPRVGFVDDRTVKKYQVNYQLLNRTGSPIAILPARVANPLSGDWSVPGTLPVYTGTVNTNKPQNKFKDGILAGGIRISTISQLGNSPLLAPLFGFVRVDITIYYQDNEENCFV